MLRVVMSMFVCDHLWFCCGGSSSWFLDGMSVLDCLQSAHSWFVIVGEWRFWFVVLLACVPDVTKATLSTIAPCPSSEWFPVVLWTSLLTLGSLEL